MKIYYRNENNMFLVKHKTLQEIYDIIKDKMIKGEEDALIILGFLPFAVSITIDNDDTNDWLEFEFPNGNIKMYNTKFEAILSEL